MGLTVAAGVPPAELVDDRSKLSARQGHEEATVDPVPSPGVSTESCQAGVRAPRPAPRILHLQAEDLARSLFRRVVVSFAQAWVDECRQHKPRSRATTGKFHKGCRHHNGGPERLRALIFSNSPTGWCLPK
jgi:hypothetical protein